MDPFTPQVKVKHAGRWKEIESADLVPGDMVSFKIGDNVPADCRSLPQSEKGGDRRYSYVESFTGLNWTLTVCV